MRKSAERIGIAIVALFILGLAPVAYAKKTPALGKKVIKIERGYTDVGLSCINCHAEKMPGTVAAWKQGAMAKAGIGCADCHVVDKKSPMAVQCSGVRGTATYISPMVSSKTCARCHPEEVNQFLKSGHAALSSAAVMDPKKGALQKLMYLNEGLAFMDGGKIDLSTGLTPKGHPRYVRSSRSAGCQMCHGTEVEMGPDNKPINETWPGGVGTRYPDGSIGNCSVCHTRHNFSVAAARKPEACGACHLGPDHPNIEIYHESKHGQVFLTQGEEWNWDAASDAWEPGDYLAPTCATCHMSGIGDLSTTHNVQERLKWDLMHKVSVVRSGNRGDGEKGDKLMRKVCVNCHGVTHTNVQRDTLDGMVELYNKIWAGTVKMQKELKAKGLLKKDPWSDGFLELAYHLWHHTGRRARQGAAMNAPDYAHWHGTFQMFQIYKDLQNIHAWRLKNNKIEELSTVMSTAPD